MMLRVAFVLIFQWILQTQSFDLLEAYRHVCPYNSLCKMDPLYQFDSVNSSVPCCEQCSCDENCWVRNDCCPDVPYERPAEVDKLICRPAAHFFADDNFEEYLSTHRRVIFKYYLMKNKCPDSTDPVLKQKCNGSINATLGDFIVVSNKARPYEIFMNKHCASCHDVNDLIPWKLQAEKCEAKYLAKASETLDGMKTFLKDNCILHSIPPEDPPLGRLPICQSDAFSTCASDTSTSRNVDELSERCTSDGHFLTVEHLYTNSGSLEYRRYKNPFCLAACSGDRNLSESLVTCRKELFEYPFSRAFKDLTLLINTDPTPMKPRVNLLCNETFVYDEYTNGCRKLHCPHFQHPYYGQCVSITRSVPDLAMAIHYVFIPDESIIIEGKVQPSSKSTAERVAGEIITGLKLEKCRLRSVKIRAYQYRNTSELLSVNTRIQMSPNADGKCTRHTMAENLSSNFGKFHKFDFPINNRSIEMKGRFDVFKPPGFSIFHDSFLYVLTGLYQSGGVKFITDSPRLPCPYVTLDKEEFCWFVGEYLGGECNRNVSLDLPGNLFDDLFSLDENTVGICLKTYRQYTSTASVYSYDSLLMTLVLAALLSLNKF